MALLLLLPVLPTLELLDVVRALEGEAYLGGTVDLLGVEEVVALEGVVVEVPQA